MVSNSGDSDLRGPSWTLLLSCPLHVDRLSFLLHDIIVISSSDDDVRTSWLRLAKLRINDRTHALITLRPNLIFS